ncbi:MAG: YiiD C-terminal domain-containing protein [Bacteroidales bacterium]|nr:YiiD C-terminal domain-containing protein [Bacteroidales bacterium]
MNVLEIPFNKYLGLKKSVNNDGFILKLEERKELLNHLGTLHAGSLFALAEATSGEFLLNQFCDYNLDIIPLVRKVEIKYSKPGNGTIFSKANFVNSKTDEIINELNTRRRVIINVNVDIFDSSSEKIMTSIFDWFVMLK